MDHLTSAEQVFNALGGVAAVAAMTGRKYTAAHNWLSFKKFPPNTYVALTEALAAKGKTAPASLWGMVEPASEQVSAA